MRNLCLAGIGLLVLGILQYALWKDDRAQVGGRYLLNGAPFLVAYLGACLPEHEKGGGKSVLWLSASAMLGLLIAAAAGWWLVVLTHYETVLSPLASTS